MTFLNQRKYVFDFCSGNWCFVCGSHKITYLSKPSENLYLINNSDMLCCLHHMSFFSICRQHFWNKVLTISMNFHIIEENTVTALYWYFDSNNNNNNGSFFHHLSYLGVRVGCLLCEPFNIQERYCGQHYASAIHYYPKILSQVLIHFIVCTWVKL